MFVFAKRPCTRTRCTLRGGHCGTLYTAWLCLALENLQSTLLKSKVVLGSPGLRVTGEAGSQCVDWSEDHDPLALGEWPALLHLDRGIACPASYTCTCHERQIARRPMHAPFGQSFAPHSERNAHSIVSVERELSRACCVKALARRERSRARLS